MRRESTGGDRVTCLTTWRGDEVGSDIEEVTSDYTDVPFPAEESHGCRQIRPQWVSWTRNAKKEGADAQQQANHGGFSNMGARQRRLGKEKANGRTR